MALAREALLACGAVEDEDGDAAYDKAEEEAAAAKQLDLQAQVRHGLAKEDLEAATAAIGPATKWKELATSVASKCKDAFEAAMETEAEAVEELAYAVKRYGITMRGPVQPHDPHDV